ncbi:hypothetical protein N5079_34035 [Planotetraspora sp. A-T 1434]|uniref:hypothetical protein n=1 Tax=Planotetraspora sp. A-T 1434 TaxID=2979219 RepID=UPI0021C0299F|nr:hypothetical protein [Planotetraspora sp. A-T 1434]MCT9935234.1 hypothetical protein [Planotetraspora sp. A-T 1434]
MTAPMTGSAILGIDSRSRTVTEAEHLLHTVVEALGLPSGVIGCTHFVRTGLPHVACSLAVPSPVDLALLPEGVSGSLSSGSLGESRTGPDADGAARAAAEHETRGGGRIVLFPGRDQLVGTVSVGDLLARSAIDRVLVLAQTDPPPADVQVVTNDHVRPVWQDGRMTLLTMPALGGRLTPAEIPNPTPCCADHG